MVLSLLRRLFAAHPDRRLEPRGVRVEGRVALGGRHYRLKDWSRRGFSAVGVAAEHYPGDKITLSVEVDLEGESLQFDCRAIVVWVDRERQELAAVFTELDRRVQERIMRSLFARRAEQQSVGAPLHA